MGVRELDWDATIGQKIRIYRNLNNGTMSIQTHTKGTGWRVAGHVTNAIVADGVFHISESGRQRVIAQNRKNVHAWYEGVLIGQFNPSIDCPIDLAYNPYINETFVERRSQRAIKRCKYLVVRNNLVFVSPDALPAIEPKNESSSVISLFTMFTWQPLFVAA